MELLIQEHESTITDLYTKLSNSPKEFINSNLNELTQSIQLLLSSQLTLVQSKVNEAETTLTNNWKKVSDWKLALGESTSTPGLVRKEGIPLESLLEQVETILTSMRSRIQQRGLSIISLTQKLVSLRNVLGNEFITVELENIQSEVELEGESTTATSVAAVAAWEGLDLRLERLSVLEREVLRGENEIVSLS